MGTTKQDIEFAKKRLRECTAKPYIVTVRRSKTGMSRNVRVFSVWQGEITDVTLWVACALGYRLDRFGIRIGGCGFDCNHAVGEHLVQEGYFKDFVNGHSIG